MLSSESRNGLADRCIHPAAAVAGPKCRQRRYKGGPSNEIHREQRDALRAAGGDNR